MRFSLCLLFALFLFGVCSLPVSAMDFAVVKKEYRTTSYGKQVALTLSVQNAQGLEYGVSSTVRYRNGTTSGTIYICRTDGSGCKSDYQAGWYLIEDFKGDREGDLVSYIEFYIVKAAGGGERELVERLDYNDLLEPGDPGSVPGTDPDDRSDDPGSYPSDPDDGSDGSGSDPGGGSGGSSSCLCCEEVASMLGDLVDAVDSSGYKLGEIYDVLGQLNDAVEQQGYKLDEIKGVLHDVSDKLDTANDHLSNISDQVTPKGTYNIDVPDWGTLIDGEEVPYLSEVRVVRDTNTYFSDPGEGQLVPGMPEQPDENYPVPIGESLGRQDPITAEPSLSPDLPKTTSPVGQASPVLVPESPRSVTPMQAEPVRQKDQLSLDPVRQRDLSTSDPVRQRTHIYERQEVPGR